MPNSILLMSFGASLVLNVADELPNFNVEASCKAVEGPAWRSRIRSSRASGRKRREGRARAKWTTYPPAVRSHCVAETMVGDPSYVDVLTCLQMAQDPSDKNAAARRKQDQAPDQERFASPSVKDGDVPSGAALCAAFSNGDAVPRANSVPMGSEFAPVIPEVVAFCGEPVPTSPENALASLFRATCIRAVSTPSHGASELYPRQED